MTAPMGAALRALAVKRGARLRHGGSFRGERSHEEALNHAQLVTLPERAQP